METGRVLKEFCTTENISQENSILYLTELKEERGSLPGEIETIVEYNIRWSEIRDSASTEGTKNEAIKAIETNGKLLVEKQDRLKAIEEYLASITLNAKVWRKHFLSLPFTEKVYEVGTVELGESAILIKLSKNKITKSEGGEFAVVAGTVTKLEVRHLSLKFTVKGLGQFTAKVVGIVPFYQLINRLEEYFSTETKREQIEEKGFLERLQIADQKTWATWVLIALNTSIFFLMLLQGYGVFSPNTVIAVNWGANIGSLTLSGEWWRLVTSMFLHFGVIHLSLNMLVLYQNEFLERLFGRTNFLLIYLISGTAGSLTSLWYSPWKISAGASGAIFGLCGAITSLVLLPRLKLSTKFKKELIRNGVFFIVINGTLAYFIPFIDKAAHVGGYLAGLALGALFSKSIYREANKKTDLRTFVYSISGLGGALVISYFFIYQNENIQRELPDHQADFYLYKSQLAQEEKNYSSALQLAKISSDFGSKDAPNKIGYLISNGFGAPVNNEEAMEWFKLGAKRRDPWATKNLANLYESQKPRVVSYSDILKLHITAASLGNFEAINYVPLKILFCKFHSECDLTAVATFVNTLASDQSPPMLGLKGWMVYFGYGYTVRKIEGERLILKAFELGDPKSAEVLGRLYLNGIDRAKDFPKAFEFFSIGAKRGDPRAMYQLGICYRDGLGTVQDKEQSFLWIKKAALLGEIHPRLNLPS